jgi:hypothetical protein
MIRLLAGLFLLLGAVGRDDAWLACHAAADCLAGPAPTVTSLLVYSSIGLALCMWAAVDLNKEYS